MRIEWLIAFYMLVCLAMTVFNFVFLFGERTQDRRLQRRQRVLTRAFDNLISDDALPDEKERRYLEKMLKSLPGLEAFDASMERLKERNPVRCERFLGDLSPLFERLMRAYVVKPTLKCAYFAYIIGRWYVQRPAAQSILDNLLKIIRTQPFYARQNALAALAHLGEAHALVEAVAALEQAETFHHPKLVTESLLAFTGDRIALSHELMQRFDRFDPSTQAAIINYKRLVKRDRTSTDENILLFRWVKNLMKDPGTDKEVRLACMRFFMTHTWHGAAGALRKLAAHDESGEWENAAVAATALAHYPDSKTVDVLKQCLSSRQWHVRQNAAKSLCDLGLSLDDLRDVLEGHDRYARDALIYRWEADRGIRYAPEAQEAQR